MGTKVRAIIPSLMLFLVASCSHEMLLSDPQGNVYKTIDIGRQRWMAANLLLDVGQGSYCYDDDSLQCKVMGRLYTWSAAQAAASQIPGWHLPSKEEWRELIAYCGGDSVGYSAIVSPDSGFDPQWAGVRTSAGEFRGAEFRGVNYWSSSSADTNETFAYSVAILSHVRTISPHNYPKANACSVRLLRNR